MSGGGGMNARCMCQWEGVVVECEKQNKPEEETHDEGN